MGLQKLLFVQAGIAGLFLSVLITACQDSVPDPAESKPLEVVAYTIEAQDTPVSFEFVGKTASSRRVEIRSRVEGFLEKRHYTEGEFVENGDLLFEMDRKPFEAKLQASKAELAQQQARAATAKINLNRARPLVKKKAVAQKELDDAQGTYRTAAAAVEVAQANVVQAELNLGYTMIASPVSGLSSFATQREGAFIGKGADPLTYVAQVDPMWIEFSVSENQLLKQRENEKSGLLKLPEDDGYEVEVVLADGSVYPHKGKITFADASLSEETGTFLIRAEVANPQTLLRPGQFVRAWIKGAVRPKAVLVPKRAVQQGPKGSFIWVINKEDKAEFRPITVGNWYQDQWFVDEGLNDGETVVVEGAQKVRAGAALTIAQPTEAAAAKDPS
ncbi:MAG: efflux RND transporter periplasmic adaptor subunit [Gammaproteobacteria bacterium]|nr:efflux RND transporter periplasmic adaptor subunit [Gammaproteobacteria bacterium]